MPLKLWFPLSSPHGAQPSVSSGRHTCSFLPLTLSPLGHYKCRCATPLTWDFLLWLLCQLFFLYLESLRLWFPCKAPLSSDAMIQLLRALQTSPCWLGQLETNPPNTPPHQQSPLFCPPACISTTFCMNRCSSEVQQNEQAFLWIFLLSWGEHLRMGQKCRKTVA